VFGIPYTIIRPSALYGQRCVSRRVGQTFIENAIRCRPLTVTGASDALDFTYIDDLVQGVVRVIAQPSARNEIFNMTYGASRTVGELADMVRQHFPGLDITEVPRDAQMPERGTLSIEKARRLLGYEPSYPLERGFVEYIRWYQQLAAEQPELFREP
jgi:nucleoside-diphosphate-sugar epimerase